MDQRKKILTTAVYLMACMLAIGLFGWFFIICPQLLESHGTASSHAVPRETASVSTAAAVSAPAPTAEPSVDTEAPSSSVEPPDGQVIAFFGEELDIPMKLEELVRQGFTYAVIPGDGNSGTHMLEVYHQGKRAAVVKMAGVETGNEQADDETDYASITQGDTSSHLEDVLKHVTIAGVPMSFPLTVQDLLDRGFTYESAEPLSRKEKNWSFVLVYQGRRLMYASAQSKKKEAGLAERQITSLQADYGESGMEDFALCGVKKDFSRGDVLKIWGQGESTPWGLRYQGGTDGKKVVDLYFSRDGKLSSVYISVAQGG